MIKEKHILPTKILVKRVEEVQKETASGIIIPTTTEEVTSHGIVVLVGEGTDKIPVPLKEGQHVFYPPRAPMKVRYEDDDYYLLNIQDVLLYW